MRRLNLLFVLLALLVLVNFASAGTYTLTDGTTVSGDPIDYSFNPGGLTLKLSGGQTQRIEWSKLTQESIKQIAEETKTPRDKAIIASIQQEAEEVVEQVKRKEIVVKPVEHPNRPTKNIGIFAAFSSPLGLMIFILLYAANIFAAYEIALYRYQSPGLVCGISAVAPVIAPIIFLCIKPKLLPQETIATHRATESDMSVSTGAPPVAAVVEESDPLAPPPGAHSPLHTADAVGGHAPRPVLPEPIIFRRGEFSFNRRFFETKLAGFMRVVPGEAEKELVVYVKSARGDFAGRRVTQITPNDLTLQVFKGGATADETIPFTELLEVQIRHQDSF